MEIADIEKILEDRIKAIGRLNLGDIDTSAKLVDLKLAKESFSKLKDLSDSIIDLKLSLNTATDRIIKSNESLAESNEKYSIWSRRLTISLLVVTVLQLGVMFGQYQEAKRQNVLTQAADKSFR